jgi:hypothetical protein
MRKSWPLVNSLTAHPGLGGPEQLAPGLDVYRAGRRRRAGLVPRSTRLTRGFARARGQPPRGRGLGRLASKSKALPESTELGLLRSLDGPGGSRQLRAAMPAVRARISAISAWWLARSFRFRVLSTTLLVFSLLVSAKLHGSAIALTTKVWAPEKAERHYVAAPLLERMTPAARERWRHRLLAESPYIRMDEWAAETPWAFAQFSHVPRFPVVNGNIGGGQNMLIPPWIPVAHVTALARPMTWGYLLLGAERGLAWAWWSQAFLCFAALYLFFELVVPERLWLAVLGAAWYTGSAYVIVFSLWPAYTTGLGVGALVAAYWALRSDRPGVIYACAAAFALCVVGFVQQLYPPWLIPLGQVFLVAFLALFWRDRLWQGFRRTPRAHLVGLGIAAGGAGLLAWSYYLATTDALHAMANSEYPGQRRLLGGDVPWWHFGLGHYNYFTIDNWHTRTPTIESASFFPLYPAVWIAALVSPRVRARLGPLIWALTPVLLGLLYFCAVGVPEWLARITLLDRVSGVRTPIATGFVAVLFVIRLLAVGLELPRDRGTLRTALLVFVVCAALYTWCGWEMQSEFQSFGLGLRFPPGVWLIALAGAALSSMLVLGWARPFAALLLAGLVATSATFNPLSSGFPDWRTSELGVAVREVVQKDRADHPPGERAALWLTYGLPSYPTNGIVAEILGARALSGVYFYPQLDFWEPLDRERENMSTYNRFATVHLMPTAPDFSGVQFHLNSQLMFRVWVAPTAPELREMDARYVLQFGEPREGLHPSLSLLYKGQTLDFSIWKLPAGSP